MSPLEIYQQYITSKKFKEDPQQFHVIQEFQRIFLQLKKRKQIKFFKKIAQWFGRTSPSILGLYLWGSVGIGKTWMMDIFYQSLTEHKKLRMHFHEFMYQIHEALKKHQGSKNPLNLIAKQIAEKAEVLCFDEFFVKDITDAMLLNNLLTALFHEGVIFIATSNVPPDDLYKNGLQRMLFLPAIALIKNHTVVMHLKSHQDYRMQLLKRQGFYFFPLDQIVKNEMTQFFEYLAGEWSDGELLTINDRPILTIKKGLVVVWFSFQDLCNVPRSQNDYLVLAKTFKTVFLSSMPKITKEQENLIQYLINLIDVFYDAKVRLVISAEVPLDEIYTEGRLLFEFQRTKSRMREMQSLEYWDQKEI